MAIAKFSFNSVERSYSLACGKITYETLTLSNADLKDIRRAIFHSEGPGYFIFSDFLNSDFTAQISSFWAEGSASEKMRRFRSKAHIRYGCPNFYNRGDGNNECYYNYFWNTPLDSASYAAAFAATILRNRIEGYEPYREFFPLPGHPTFSRIPYSVSFRIIISRSGQIVVPPHGDRDFYGAMEPWRTQMTLFLSERDVDYTGGGFFFENNQGDKLLFGRDIDVKPGDLVVWRYANIHSVENIQSTETGRGFMRIVFPPERVHKPNAFIRFSERIMATGPIDKLVGSLKSTQFAKKYLRPLAIKLRGL